MYTVEKSVTRKLLIVLAATNLVLLAALLVILSADSSRGSRYHPTKFEAVWFDSKTAQICSARHRVKALKPTNPFDNAYDKIFEDAGTITASDGTVLDSANSLPFCSDLM